MIAPIFFKHFTSDCDYGPTAAIRSKINFEVLEKILEPLDSAASTWKIKISVKMWKSIILELEMDFVFIFCFCFTLITYATVLIQCALQSLDFVEARKCFKHHFWSCYRKKKLESLDLIPTWWLYQESSKSMWKSIKYLKMRWASFSLRPFCSEHATVLIQRA